jgi:ATP-dependent DNA ligase
MSFLRRKPAAAPPEPADWRPQAYSRGSFRSIKDPIIEPSWGGVRVIARVGHGPDGRVSVTLTDDDGVDATAEFDTTARALGEAALAEELILDGYLTIEPTQPSEGVGEAPLRGPSASAMVGHMFVGGRLARERGPAPGPRLDPERPIAFVAIDMLLIDGTRVVDLPLIERKRLLDGALAQGELVRITPYVRPPIGSFMATWRALGFRELVFKSANGRYHPDGQPGEWATAPMRR